jgi:hypothetical protein
LTRERDWKEGERDGEDEWRWCEKRLSKETKFRVKWKERMNR